MRIGNEEGDIKARTPVIIHYSKEPSDTIPEHIR
jgi:hypothetical protein